MPEACARVDGTGVADLFCRFYLPKTRNNLFGQFLRAFVVCSVERRGLKICSEQQQLNRVFQMRSIRRGHIRSPQKLFQINLFMEIHLSNSKFSFNFFSSGTDDARRTSQRPPVSFVLDNVEATSSYRLILFAVNQKGRSEPVIIDDITFKGVAKFTGEQPARREFCFSQLINIQCLLELRRSSRGRKFA